MSACAAATQKCCVPRQPRSTTGRRIVLVDDEPKILETWGAILSQSGYEVQSFPDPIAALEAISGGCDCVITDYHLPRMTGVELIRAAHPWSKAKFILMTANGSEAVTREALSVGACCVVHKPTSPPVVLQKIASLCV
jgi:DNA-binding response OmpR family regulator